MTSRRHSTALHAALISARWHSMALNVTQWHSMASHLGAHDGEEHRREEASEHGDAGGLRHAVGDTTESDARYQSSSEWAIRRAMVGTEEGNRMAVRCHSPVGDAAQAGEGFDLGCAERLERRATLQHRWVLQHHLQRLQRREPRSCGR